MLPIDTADEDTPALAASWAVRSDTKNLESVEEISSDGKISKLDTWCVVSTPGVLVGAGVGEVVGEGRVGETVGTLVEPGEVGVWVVGEAVGDLVLGEAVGDGVGEAVVGAMVVGLEVGPLVGEVVAE
mmetsp:Transcript_13147/g.27863  ORF Transcript_13147/g.27863 Transcript_13147/m.27863 type:complete len:128 (-) Transcript_13147:106-489(-)